MKQCPWLLSISHPVKVLRKLYPDMRMPYPETVPARETLLKLLLPEWPVRRMPATDAPDRSTSDMLFQHE